MAYRNNNSDTDWRPLVTEQGREVWEGNRGGKWFGPTPGVIDGSAPQHDFSKDKPMSPSAPYQLSRNNVTPTGIWNEMFRPRQQTAPQPPSLTTLAAGGMNHATAWMSGEQRAAQGQRDVAKYIQPGTTPMTTYDGSFGTRQPVIAGANGLNVGPSIANKVNPNDPTLDPTFLKKFSWSSAFNI